MKNRFRGKKQHEQFELEQNKQIKPKLQEFVRNLQREKAQASAKEQNDFKAKIAKNFNVWEELIKRGSQLALIAFLKQKIWQKIPPYFEMKWIARGTVNAELQQELDNDMAGFASFLAREYMQYTKLKNTGRGYPNPMQEQNLIFFWEKWNFDLRLLVEADKRRTAAGNKSLIMSEPEKPSGIILPPGMKRHES